jgi:hypothetical protein
MPSSRLSPQVLAPIMLLLFLCLALIWQRRRKLGQGRSQPSITEYGTVQSPHVVSCRDRVREGGSLLDDEKGSFTSSNPASATLLNRACLTEILQSSITSGQYAAMVRWQAEQKDAKISSMHPPPHPWTSQASCSRITPWSGARIEENIKIESHSVDFYRGSEPQEIWRRRVLAFVGQ